MSGPRRRSQLETQQGVANSDEEYPDVNANPYELRFTQRALEDLRVARNTPAGSLRKIRTITPWPDVVDDFINQRTISPHTTGGHLHNMGRPDIAELHTTSGGRAATWYDKENEVVWFLGFTPEHHYKHLEVRAAADQLLPDHEDLTALILEREELDFSHRVKVDLYALLRDACSSPGEPRKGRVGQLLRLEVTAIVIEIDTDKLADFYVLIRLPPRAEDTPPPPGWPGKHLQARLAELICDRFSRGDDVGDESDCDEGNFTASGATIWEAPYEVPDGRGGMRSVKPEEELPIRVESCDISDFE